MSVLIADPDLLGWDFSSSRVFQEILFLDYSARTSSVLTFTDYGGNAITFTGSDIRYQMQGVNITGITGGTFRQVIVTVDYDRALSWTGLNVSVKAAADALFAGDWGRLNNLLLGGDDRITATNGGDRLNGFAGDDRLRGLGGRDIMKGGTGNDTLTGGKGNDVLAGGEGRDAFVFSEKVSEKWNLDRISDFVSGEDRIELRGAVFDAVREGGLWPRHFVLGAQAHDGDDRIIYQPSTGALWYDPDGTGARAQVQIAELQDRTTLTASDILVF